MSAADELHAACEFHAYFRGIKMDLLTFFYVSIYFNVMDVY